MLLALPGRLPSGPLPGSPLESTLPRRLIWSLIPAAIVVVAVWTVLASEDGLLRRHELKQRLYSTQARVERLEEDNQRLRDRITALQKNPHAMRRVLAETLLMAQPGSTIYRFSTTPAENARATDPSLLGPAQMVPGLGAAVGMGGSAQ
jgi:cell division protein FtsB